MRIPPEWTKVQLGKAGKWYSGGTPSTGNPAYWNGDIPWISSGSLTNFRLTTSDRKVTIEGVENGTRLIEPETILMVVRGMSLKSEFRIGMAMRPMAFGQDCKALVAGPGLDPKFLAYSILAQTPKILGLVDEAGHGTGRLNSDQLYAVEIGVPMIHEQRAIAEVLSALDDKIAANTKLAEKLKRMTVAAFASQIGSPSNFIPLGNLVDVIKGVSYRSVDLQESQTALVTLKSFDRFGGYSSRGLKDYSGQYKPSQVIHPGEIAVAQTDLTQAAEVVGRAVRVPASRNHESLVASLDLAIVRPKVGVPNEFILGVLLESRFREHCKAHTSGTTVLHLSKDAIPTYPAPVVTTHVQNQIASLNRPALELIESVSQESETLASTRDALLPQLMSGKLRVKDLESIVSAAI